VSEITNIAKPDYTIPPLSSPPAPILGPDSNSTYQDFITETICADKYDPLPVVPFGKQDSLYSETSLYTEDGFKKVRGSLTEGRYLTFEAYGNALTNQKHSNVVSTAAATPNHEQIEQRWVIHEVDSDKNQFTISSAADGKYITVNGALSSKASAAHHFAITDLGGSKGYTIKTLGGLYLTLSKRGAVSISKTPTSFTIYSVTYAA
jgi:phospholipase C